MIRAQALGVRRETWLQREPFGRLTVPSPSMDVSTESPDEARDPERIEGLDEVSAERRETR